jgi:predicted RNA binding protein YcfA (HicA-like mRNA interferase family)
VRELVANLERADFVNRGGKGSHRNFVHPKVTKPVVLSGKLGDDAKHYQVRADGVRAFTVGPSCG